MAISKVILNGVTQMDATLATASAADILAPMTAMLADGVLTTGTGTGGGASNIVTGTFKGTTTGEAMEVDLAYTGSGYPIAIMIYPSATDSSTFNSLLQRYAIRDCVLEKYNKDSAPTYQSLANPGNIGLAAAKYKSSTSNANSYSNSGSTSVANYVFDGTNAESSTSLAVKFKSSKKMSVYIASTSYGFAANIEYKYWVLYSS